MSDRSREVTDEETRALIERLAPLGGLHDGSEGYCVFCGGLADHAPDCPWVEARAILSRAPSSRSGDVGEAARGITDEMCERLAAHMHWTHEPYPNPEGGGHDGYRARCHAPGCDWQGELFPPGQDGKHAARVEALTHGEGPTEEGIEKAREALRSALSTGKEPE